MNTNSTPEATYRKVLPEILALPPESVGPVNADIPFALGTVTGALPRLHALVQSSGPLPGLSDDILDRLGDYTVALAVAHDRHRSAPAEPPPADPLPALWKKAADLRAIWRSEFRSLASHRFLDPAPLALVTYGTGYQQTAYDLQLMAALLRRNWTSIAGKCGIDSAELELADTLAIGLLRACSQRRRQRPARSGTAELRARAFALFAATYAQVRRGVTFLRWNHCDAAAIAPSIHNGRRSTAGSVAAMAG